MQSNSLKQTSWRWDKKQVLKKVLIIRAISLWLLGNPDGQCARRTI